MRVVSLFLSLFSVASLALSSNSYHLSDEIKSELPVGSVLLYNAEKDQSILVLGIEGPATCVLDQMAKGRFKSSQEWADRLVYGVIHSAAIDRLDELFGLWMPPYSKASPERFKCGPAAKVDVLAGFVPTTLDEISMANAIMRTYLLAFELATFLVPASFTLFNYLDSGRADLRPMLFYLAASVGFNLISSLNLKDLIFRRIPLYFEKQFFAQLEKEEAGKKWLVISKTLKKRFGMQFLADGSDTLPTGFSVVYKKTLSRN